jgi:lipopolysaccharide export LptBFGC system permease protein LptF
VHITKNLPFRNVPGRRIWLVGRFNTHTMDMEKVSVIQQREDGSEAYQIQAESAQWLDGRWWFVALTIQQYDREGNPKGPPRFERGMEAPDFDETPRVFLNETKTDALQLSAREIFEYIQSHQHLDESILTRYRVDFHHRLAMPWMCFVVTLIGIPFGTYTGRKGALLGIVLCLLLFFIYYSLVNVGLAVGKKQMIEPWIAAWTPNLVFLVLGSLIVARMR